LITWTVALLGCNSISKPGRNYLQKRVWYGLLLRNCGLFAGKFIELACACCPAKSGKNYEKTFL